MAKVLVSEYERKQTKSGKTKYQCMGTVDGKITKFDMWDEPQLETEFEGWVKEDPQWGKTVSLPRSQGAPQAQTTSRKGGWDDKVSARQTALNNAVQRQIALFTAYSQLAKGSPDALDALKENMLSPKHIIEVATAFAKYVTGEETVVTVNKPAPMSDGVGELNQTFYE